MRRTNALAAVLIAIGLSLAGAGGNALLEQPAAATPPIPATSGYGVRIVWVRTVPVGSDLRCYVLRAKSRTVKAVWLCG